MSCDESVSSAVIRSAVTKKTLDPSADAPAKLVAVGPSATEKVERAAASPGGASRTTEHIAAAANAFPPNPMARCCRTQSARSRPRTTLDLRPRLGLLDLGDVDLGHQAPGTLR